MTTLRTLAEAATPGPWQTYLDGHVLQAYETPDEAWAVLDGPAVSRPFNADVFGGNHVNDARYIAAASPDVVLALIDELENVLDSNKQLAMKNAGERHENEALLARLDALETVREAAGYLASLDHMDDGCMSLAITALRQALDSAALLGTSGEGAE